MRSRHFHGEKLRELRVTGGADIRAFADAVDYSWRHIQMIETWGRQPSDKLVRRFLTELSRLQGRTVHIEELSTPECDVQAAA